MRRYSYCVNAGLFVNLEEIERFMRRYSYCVDAGLFLNLVEIVRLHAALQL